MIRTLLVAAAVIETTSDGSAAYTAPPNKFEDPPLKIFHEGFLRQGDPLLNQLHETAEGFNELQGASPITGLVSNPEVLAAATDIIESSLQPLLPEGDARAKERLVTTIKQRQGSGFGYGGMAFPEVHIWTTKTLKEIFSRGDHPPGLTLDPQTQMLSQEFVAQDGRLNPVTIIIDESLSSEKKAASTAEFLHYWLETVRRTHDSLSGVFIFSAVRDVTLSYLDETSKLPIWFRLGTANLIAYNNCAKLLGEASADNAANLYFGPSSSVKPAAVLKTKIDPKNVSASDKPTERAGFDLFRAAQANTSKTFIRLVLSATVKAKDKSQTDPQIVEIYRSAATSNKNLFGG